MTASPNRTHQHLWLSRLIVSLTIGLMTLALGAATAFAGTGTQAPQFAGNAARAATADGAGVTLNEDDEDDDDDDEDDEEGGSGGGGGLPATDTAPFVVSGLVSADGTGVTLNEDDECDDDDCEEGGSGGGGSLPATDTAPLAVSSAASTAMPAIALLVIAGLAGGAVMVAAKRSSRP